MFLKWWEKLFEQMIKMDMRHRMRVFQNQRQHMKNCMDPNCDILDRENVHEIEHLMAQLEIGNTNPKEDTPCIIGRGGQAMFWLFPGESSADDWRLSPEDEAIIMEAINEGAKRQMEKLDIVNSSNEEEKESKFFDGYL